MESQEYKINNNEKSLHTDRYNTTDKMRGVIPMPVFESHVSFVCPSV